MPSESKPRAARAPTSLVRGTWREAARLATALERDLLGWELPPIPVAFQDMPIVSDPISAWCPRCGASVGPGEVTDAGCGECRGGTSPIRRTVRIGEYGGGLAKRILQTKHLRWPWMARALGARLAAQCLESLGQELAAVEAVVSIPMPTFRRWLRGIDHAAEVAAGVAAGIGCPLWRPLRQVGGQTQVSRSRTDRRRATRRFQAMQQERAWAPLGRMWPFGLSQWRWSRPPASVLLVDDVRTTGATLEQAARLLRELGVQDVMAAVVAVASSPRRRSAAPVR